MSIYRIKYEDICSTQEFVPEIKKKNEVKEMFPGNDMEMGNGQWAIGNIGNGERARAMGRGGSVFVSGQPTSVLKNCPRKKI